MSIPSGSFLEYEPLEETRFPDLHYAPHPCKDMLKPKYTDIYFLLLIAAPKRKDTRIPFALSITLWLVLVSVFLSFRRMLGVAAKVELKV